MGRRDDDILFQVPKLTSEQTEQARKVVCSNAIDAVEAQMMLAMLGLL